MSTNDYAEKSDTRATLMFVASPAVPFATSSTFAEWLILAILIDAVDGASRVPGHHLRSRSDEAAA
jgi:hypothetical protein